MLLTLMKAATDSADCMLAAEEVASCGCRDLTRWLPAGGLGSALESLSLLDGL